MAWIRPYQRLALLALLVPVLACHGGRRGRTRSVDSGVARDTGTASLDAGPDSGDAGPGSLDAGPGPSDAGPACDVGETACGAVCVDLASDSEHCGECDVACDSGETCSDGVCELVCPSGLTNCSGVCRDVDTDRNHCGECGSPCDPGDVCTSGVCTLSCGTGLTECSGACVDTQEDPAHCGGCGLPCDTGEDCILGTCTGGGGPTVSCGGYEYPETTIVTSTSCTAWFSGCTGTRELRVVGCHSSNPGDICPSGYSPASLMLIGQWAEAAAITRYVSGTSVCAWANGGSAGTTCGGSGPHNNYCWPYGEACDASCPTNCCPPTGPCTTSGSSHPTPLLCVRDI